MILEEAATIDVVLHERCLIWNAPEVGIDWPLDREPVLSAKDQSGLSFAEAEVFA
jgi:dTDP-4-dehydrorhamnose 3,5-epimerase